MIKVIVNLSNVEVEAVRQMAAKRSQTMTNTLIQCIGTEKFISDKMKSGAKILVEETNGDINRLLFVRNC